MALQIEHLSFAYNEHAVLSGLNLTLKNGAIHGLAGINGAGKTTLLRLIAGHLKPQEGQIAWNGKSNFVKELAFLETQAWFYPLMTGHDYLDLFSAGNPSFSREEWNKLFKIPLSEEADLYSAGMQKKLALMGMLALDRSVLLMDEPFNALDLEAVELLRQILPRLSAQGKTILLTSHILETLTYSCDTIALLSGQKILQQFAKNDFYELESVLRTHHHTLNQEVLNQLFENQGKQR